MALAKRTQQHLFQAGYTAKGIVYVLIGGAALTTLIGISMDATNGPRAVIDWLGDNSFGTVILLLIGAGLLSYCAWRWYKAVQDTEHEGHNASGMIKRIAWAVSGTSYGALAVFAFRSAFAAGGGEGDTKRSVIAELLQLSWGSYAVGLIGLVILGVGIYQIYRAVTNKHMKNVAEWHLSADQEQAFRNAGRIGLTARAVVFGLIAYFLYRAATLEDASQFRGISGSLEYLEQGWGNVTLALIGAGLLAYGFFMFVRARYERV